MRKVRVKWTVKFPHVAYGNPFAPMAVCLVYPYRYPDAGKDVAEEDKKAYERYMRLCKRLVSYGAAVAGLQNTELGIAFVAETLLSNPNIRWLVVVGKGRGHRVELMYKYLREGYYEGLRNYLSRDVFDRLREQVSVLDLSDRDPFESEDLLRELIKASYQEEPTPVHVGGVEYLLYDPGAYEGGRSKVCTPAYELFSTEGLLLVKAKNIREAWEALSDALTKYGVPRRDYRGERLYLPTLVLVVEKPLDYTGLNLGALEHYWRDHFERRDPGDSYTYGNRIFDWFGVDQVEEALEKVREGKPTRAHIVLYDPRVDFRSEEAPCITEIHLSTKRGKVDLRASIRTWDVSRALPFNLYALSRILERAADALSLPAGRLVVIADEPHTYL